jgi:perosamine synthetase
MTELAVNGGKPAVEALPRRWPFYSSAVEDTVRSIIASGEVSATHPHPLVEEVERRFVEAHCPGGFGVWCGSGTAALFSAYFALGLDAGDEVLVPSMTFRATVTPLLLLNLRAIFYDANPASGEVNIEDVAARITPRTRVIVVTHLWGRPADMGAVCALAEQHGLQVVEDCSHAHGARWRDRPVGSFGTVSAFSVGTKKMVSGGTAGVMLTRDADVYQRAVLFGQPKPRAMRDVSNKRLNIYAKTGLGANLRGTPIAAALALDHLDRLSETIETKTANLELLDRAIAVHLPGLTSLERGDDWSTGAWYAYACVWSDPRVGRDTIVTALQSEGVPLEVLRPSLHRHPLFSDPSPLTTMIPGARPLPKVDSYPGADHLANVLIAWDTTELYEPATLLIEQYAVAFEKVTSVLDAGGAKALRTAPAK